MRSLARHILTLSVCLLSTPLWAQTSPEALIGRYEVRGATSSGLYTGTARIARAIGGLRLTIKRSDGTALHGKLTRRGPDHFELVQAGGRGLARALSEVGGSGKPRFEARYQITTQGLSGRWRVGTRTRVVARGLERLVRVQDMAVRLVVSVDWEGRDLTEANLRALEALRKALPQVPLTHFLNAAYFTKANADGELIAKRIRRVLRRGDEQGLHLHGWKSLVERSGVGYRDRPTFWGGAALPAQDGRDTGHDVEIGAYTANELQAIVSTSKRLLERWGFSPKRAFRAGGWLATPKVLSAVRSQGFLIDSSATDAGWHDELAGRPLRARIRSVWPGVHRTSQPFSISTPAGEVLEMPDTGALADYVTAAEMTAHVRRALSRFRRISTRDRFVHIGLHLETAARYAPRVIKAIQDLLKDPNPNLAFDTLSASARRHRGNERRAAEKRRERTAEPDAGLPPPRRRR